jgi:hypothetical protein
VALAVKVHLQPNGLEAVVQEDIQEQAVLGLLE